MRTKWIRERRVMQIQFVEGLRDPKQIIVGIVIIWAIGLICSIVTWIATKEK